MCKLFILLTTILLCHEVLSQNIRQPESLNRNLIESLIEAARQETPRYITQGLDPYTIPNPNAPVPTNIPDFPINIANPSIGASNPYTTILNPINAPNPYINLPGAAPSDPSVCKNLAHTIQLMVLSDLLKTRERDDIAMRLAGPVLSDLLSTPVRRAPIRSNFGSNLINTLSPTSIPSSVIVPSSIAGSSPRIVISPSAPNVLSGVSNGRIERGALTNMLKLLGGAL